MTKYKIWCEVSGGVTGFRAAWLKANGKEVMYDNEEDAERRAMHLNQEMNGPYSTAEFRYSVIGYES